MIFNIGDKVLYKDEEYYVFWIYNSEYLELSKDNRFHCELAHVTELTLVKTKR
jgi:signal peptidase I